ncbi:hypothetical protein THIAE_05960 [Thiomicrospira aerophila AL3]|uniref:DUF2857 domain-containing protein n=1 Tax=Thiomicrospira aerophila AL3 TaxID=717772 RepID=W0DV11_9GAMM|nr:DUF2857 domain-containing protein [Thiomicrospira aerophila]AHF02272.1 hypothetical protein THIAE_05960 [Thiomicrospira aerophila AL3]
MSKQKSLYLGIMSYVHDLIQDGDLARVKNMGFDQEMIERISKISMAELNNICNRRVCLFDIQVSKAMTLLLKDVDEGDLLDKCILAGASNEFLYRYFGLTSKAASTRRFILRFNVRHHRRIPADENQEHEIMYVYHHFLGDRTLDDLEPIDFLDLHSQVNQVVKDESEISLKVIWGVVNRYHDYEPQIASKINRTKAG